jgi:apolipoprotein N-acyltransferase
VVRHPVLPTALASIGGLATWAAAGAVPWIVSVIVRRRLGLAAGLGMLVAGHLAVEGGLSRGPWALPWGLLAQTQAPVDGIRPLAALSGPSGLSAWVALANAAAFLVIRGPGRPRRAGLAIGTGLALLALTQPTPRPGGTGHGASGAGALRALVVQPAVPPLAWTPPSSRETPQTRTDRLLAQTAAALDTLARRPDLVLWPETALPALEAPGARRRRSRLRAWAERHGVALLTGAVGRTRSASALAAGAGRANRALLVRPGAPVQRYDKHHLLPFVEAAPALPVFGRLAATRPGATTYRRGSGPQALLVAGRRVGPLICSESLVAPHARNTVRRGAGLFAVLAQTAWWGRSRAPRQHIAFTQLTAAATGRAAVVASVAGPAALVGPRGEARTLTSWMERGARTVTVPVRRARTPYVRHGDVVFWVGLAAAVGLAGAALARGAAKRRPAPSSRGDGAR